MSTIGVASGCDRGGQLPDPGRAVAEHDELADVHRRRGDGLRRAPGWRTPRRARSCADSWRSPGRAPVGLASSRRGLGEQAGEFDLAGAGPAVGALGGPLGGGGGHHGHAGAVDGDVELVRGFLAVALGGQHGQPRRVRSRELRRRSACAAVAPSVSARRSIRLADNRIPASSASRLAAAANGWAAAARAGHRAQTRRQRRARDAEIVVARRDPVVAVRRSDSRRGARVTRPSTVSRCLSR